MIILKEILQELVRNQSWAQYSDYDLIVNNTYDKIKDDVNTKIEKYGKYEFLIKPKFIRDDIGIVVCKHKTPFGVASISEFENGVKIDTIGIKPKFRGQSMSLIIYDFIINKYDKVYSDTHQTPESRKSWLKLSKKYNVKGYNITTRKLFDVSPNEDNTELKSDDPEYNLYKDNNMELSRTDQELKNYLVIIK